MSTAEVWQDSDAALVAELGALETQLHSTWAQMLSVVAEIDSRGTADGEPGDAPRPDRVSLTGVGWADQRRHRPPRRV